MARICARSMLPLPRVAFDALKGGPCSVTCQARRGRCTAGLAGFAAPNARGRLPFVHPLHDQVLAFIDDPARGTFEDLALAVFAHQFDCCEPYRQYCVGRGQTPLTVAHWRDIPAVPVQAFKRTALSCGPPERIFLSTGTTAGPAQRSRHMIPDLRLYRRSAVAGLRAFLFPDVARMRLISLIPSVDQQPQSSLAQMVAWAMEEFGDNGSGYAVSESGVEFKRGIDLLRAVERSGDPCCLMTTTGALLHFLDHLHARGLAFRLPHGSRLMDTGGDKGAPRRSSRRGLLHACWNAFAVPGYFCVNEYGMTELSSQFYDNVLADRFAGRHRKRFLVGPHWTRTLVLDPQTLTPSGPSARGLLCHFDLANAGSALAVLTEDVGRAGDGGFELLGRASGAEARGCSLSAAEWEAA